MQLDLGPLKDKLPCLPAAGGVVEPEAKPADDAAAQSIPGKGRYSAELHLKAQLSQKMLDSVRPTAAGFQRDGARPRAQIAACAPFPLKLRRSCCASTSAGEGAL